MIFKLPNRLSSLNSPGVFQSIAEVINESPKEVLFLDYAKTQYVSSAWLRILGILRKLIIARGGEQFHQINPTPIVREIFEVTGFDEIYPFDD